MRDQKRTGAFGRRRSGNGKARPGGPAAVPLEPLEPHERREPRERLEPIEPIDALEAEFARTPSFEGAGPVGSARPRIAGPLEAFLRHPLPTLVPLVLLVAAAFVLGTERDPEYTSQARITVGNTDVSPFLLEKVVAGNAAIAASYARATEAEPVARAAGREVGISPAEAADRLSGTQVPGSTLIQVEAKGQSPAAAVGLANAGAEALIAYITRINRTDQAPSLFKQYRKAQADARRAERRTQALLSSSRPNQAKVTRARIAQDLALLRATDLANRYRDASAQATAASRLTLIAPAAGADSDRSEVLEQLLIAAAVGGLVLGLALALLLANWRVLRSLRSG